MDEELKEVRVYFYNLTIQRIKKDNSNVYDIRDIAKIFSNLLTSLMNKELTDRRIDNTSLKEVIWLDNCVNSDAGNYNIIFKSARYNRVRNEIDTRTMTELGTRKSPHDGDEEKTHICIRLNPKRKSFLVVHEGNSDGIPIGRIMSYLNEKLEEYCTETKIDYEYILTSEVIPGDDFLTTLKNSKKSITILELRINSSILNPYMIFGKRDDVIKETYVKIKKPKGLDSIPDDMIKTYYDDMQSDSVIQRVTAISTNEKIADTEAIRMKRILDVHCIDITKEVDSEDFFFKAQKFIDQYKSGGLS